jgi:hypothetical protein
MQLRCAVYHPRVNHMYILHHTYVYDLFAVKPACLCSPRLQISRVQHQESGWCS